jgi:hypothetical protein
MARGEVRRSSAIYGEPTMNKPTRSLAVTVVVGTLWAQLPLCEGAEESPPKPLPLSFPVTADTPELRDVQGTLTIEEGGILFRHGAETNTLRWKELASASTRTEGENRVWCFTRETDSSSTDRVLSVRFKDYPDLFDRVATTLLSFSGFQTFESRAETGKVVSLDFRPGPSAKDLYANAYDRRGYKLGITISEFRATPFPDEGGWPGARPRFSDEMQGEHEYLSALVMSDDLVRAGVIKSTFYFRSKTLGILEEAGLSLAGEGAQTIFYFIAEAPLREPRLFLIETRNPTSRYEELRSVYTLALKEEPRITTDTVQNGLGAQFQNEISTWTNGISTLTLSRYGDTRNVLRIRHVLNPLWKVFEERLHGLDREKAKKL